MGKAFMGRIGSASEAQATLATSYLEAMDKILQACTRPSLAEGALYSYSRGGSEITGPSIRLAEVAASMESSTRSSVSGATTRVRTRPRVIAPPSSRSDMIRLLISLVVVSGISTIILLRPFRRSWPPPFPARTLQHLKCRVGSPGAGLVGVRARLHALS